MPEHLKQGSLRASAMASRLTPVASTLIAARSAFKRTGDLCSQ